MELKNKKQVLITGTAGFIGFHVACNVAAMGYEVIGVDNINDYYDINLKFDRLNKSGFKKANILPNEIIKSDIYPNFKFLQLDLSDKNEMTKFFSSQRFDQVIHLAAQPGVRYSLQNPHAYIESNIISFLNILEGCRHQKIPKLIYASSSSVYGNNIKIPFSEADRVDEPVSLYAATKKCNELMAYTYSHLYEIQTIGLRFFTVYGPWGRPDMAPMLFANAILNNQPIDVFNGGNLERDFTYINDIVNSIIKISEKETNDLAMQEVFNIGNGSPTSLMDFITELENQIGKTAKKEMREMQPGDVFRTYADTEKLNSVIGVIQKTNLKDGIREFVKWYLQHAQQRITA